MLAMELIITTYCNLNLTFYTISQEKNAVFCDFLSLYPHILPYTYREPQAEKHRSQKSEEAALPHSIFFHGTKPTPYTSSLEDLPSALRDACQIGSAVSVFAKHFEAIPMARSF